MFDRRCKFNSISWLAQEPQPISRSSVCIGGGGRRLGEGGREGRVLYSRASIIILL